MVNVFNLSFKIQLNRYVVSSVTGMGYFERFLSTKVAQLFRNFVGYFKQKLLR